MEHTPSKDKENLNVSKQKKLSSHKSIFSINKTNRQTPTSFVNEAFLQKSPTKKSPIKTKKPIPIQKSKKSEKNIEEIITLKGLVGEISKTKFCLSRIKKWEPNKPNKEENKTNSNAILKSWKKIDENKKHER